MDFKGRNLEESDARQRNERHFNVWRNDERDERFGNASGKDDFDPEGRRRSEERSYHFAGKNRAHKKSDYVLESSESESEEKKYNTKNHQKDYFDVEHDRRRKDGERSSGFHKKSRFDDAEIDDTEAAQDDWRKHERERFSGRENQHERSRSRGESKREDGSRGWDIKSRHEDRGNSQIWEDDGPPGSSSKSRHEDRVSENTGRTDQDGEKAHEREENSQAWDDDESARDRRKSEDDGPPGSYFREMRSNDRGNWGEDKRHSKWDQNQPYNTEEEHHRWKNNEDQSKGYDRKKDSRSESDRYRWNKSDGENDSRASAWFCECGFVNYISRSFCALSSCKRPRLPSYRVGKFPSRGPPGASRFPAGPRYGSLRTTNTPRPPIPLNQAYTLADVPQLAAYSAAMYATTPQETAHYMQYYTTYYTNQLTSPTTESDKVNAAAAVAQSAISQLQQAKTVSQAVAATPAPNGVITGFENRLFPVPDVTSYLYDQSSGYYYDSTTGLYFDPQSQYYFNNQIQQFMYYNSTTMQYCLVPAAGATVDPTAAAVPAPAPPAQAPSAMVPPPTPNAASAGDNKIRKVDKNKEAKQIAKDMARWAKSMNQKKEMTAKAEAMAAEAAASVAASSGSADIGFSVLENRTSAASVPKAPPPVATLVSYGDGSESEGDEDEGIIDWNKLICLLCKRQFPSKEVLSKHQVMSDLHKENLSKYRVANPKVNSKVVQNTSESYRDRAAERRSKYGEDDQPPVPAKKQFNYAAPVSSLPREIGEDNVGNRLLKKMGWSSGQGLGKAGQGRVGPVEATSGGLGTQKRGIYTAGPGETYRGCVKKLTMARYQDLVGNQD